jgi:hypothetical protein
MRHGQPNKKKNKTNHKALISQCQMKKKKTPIFKKDFKKDRT